MFKNQRNLEITQGYLTTKYIQWHFRQPQCPHETCDGVLFSIFKRNVRNIAILYLEQNDMYNNLQVSEYHEFNSRQIDILGS